MNVDLDMLRELRKAGVQSAKFAGGELVEVSLYAMGPEELGLEMQAAALREREEWLNELDDTARAQALAKAQEELLYGSSV